MNNKGVTLIELLVVIAIIGILAIALGFSYQGWIGRYRVESNIKQMYADLMDARVRAMNRNIVYFADFPTSTSYRITEDTNNNNALNVGAGDTVLPTFPKTIDYPISGVVTLTFNRRGLISSGAPPTLITVPVEINLTLPADVNPDYDCIRISQTRINMGLINTATGACDEK